MVLLRARARLHCPSGAEVGALRRRETQVIRGTPRGNHQIAAECLLQTRLRLHHEGEVAPRSAELASDGGITRLSSPHMARRITAFENFGVTDLVAMRAEIEREIHNRIAD